MFELRTFGAIDLRDGEARLVSGVLAQPKRLALLAYLVLARPRGLQRRDTLVALFWPDLDERRARNALSQALHNLRRELPGVVHTRGIHEVGVDATSLVCDVLRFEDELVSGDVETAFDRYRGELLPALHVAGCVGLEHWLDLERARLGRMARDAARRAADAAAAAGSTGGTLRILHRALELFPADESLFGRLVEVLRESGDRTGIAGAWEAFRRRMAEDVGIEPGPDTIVLVEDALRGARQREGVAGAASAGATIRSIAVLPLQDLGAGGASYSAAGMTEALITELGRVRSLRVISHQSVLRFRDSREPLRTIALALGVDALIEGSVVEAGGRVRVTAQLVRAVPEEHLWADAYETDADDVIAMHRDLAQAIANAVSAVVSAEDRQQLGEPRRVHPAAYEAYLQGWMNHASIIPERLARAVALYQRAIALDPGFAPAYANLGIMFFGLLSMGEIALEEGLPTMRSTVDTALQLEPDQAPGITARGLLHMIAHHWAAAERDLLDAVAIAPNLSMGWTHLAFLLTGMGRFDEAAEAAERSLWLDPLAPYAHFVGGWSLHYAGRAHEAVRLLRRALEIIPDYSMAWIFLAKSHYQLGDRADALHACARSLELQGANPMTLAYVARVRAGLEDADGAADALARLEAQRDARGFASPYYMAIALGALGRREEALAQIDRIEPAASTTGWLLAVDPHFDPIRDDPRFTAALERIGLAGPST